jgi:hypothetical protein
LGNPPLFWWVWGRSACIPKWILKALRAGAAVFECFRVERLQAIGDDRLEASRIDQAHERHRRVGIQRALK